GLAEPLAGGGAAVDHADVSTLAERRRAAGAGAGAAVAAAAEGREAPGRGDNGREAEQGNSAKATVSGVTGRGGGGTSRSGGRRRGVGHDDPLPCRRQGGRPLLTGPAGTGRIAH